jgi:16S rRNA (guanine527-N7)-methyltransferase
MMAPNKEEAELFTKYKELIVSWNRTHNLMSKSGIKEIDLHIQDSLSVQDKLTQNTLLDVGSGAGFPGIPLAIKKPETKVYLVESNKKKAAFLLHCTLNLGLKNVTVYNGRVEDLKIEKAQRVEMIGRAFGTLENSLKCASGLLDDGAVLFLMRTKEEPIGKKYSKKYKIISTENIYSELRSQKGLLIKIGLVQ